jgi:hypothetical protein
MPFSRGFGAVVLGSLLAAACGGSGSVATPTPPTVTTDEATSEPAEETPTPSEEPTPTPEPTTEEPTPTQEPTTEEPTEDETSPFEDEFFTGTEATATEMTDVMGGTDEMAVEDLPPPEMTVPVDDTPYSGYSTVIDDTGLFSIDVPVEWTSIDTAPSTRAGNPWPQVIASFDIDLFNTTWTTPGVVMNVGAYGPDPSLDPNTMMDEVIAQYGSACETVAERQQQTGANFFGGVDVYEGCGDEQATYIVVGVSTPDLSVGSLLQMQVNSARDLDAYEVITGSLVLYQ